MKLLWVFILFLFAIEVSIPFEKREFREFHNVTQPSIVKLLLAACSHSTCSVAAWFLGTHKAKDFWLQNLQAALLPGCTAVLLQPSRLISFSSLCLVKTGVEPSWGPRKALRKHAESTSWVACLAGQERGPGAWQLCHGGYHRGENRSVLQIRK